MFGRYVRGKRLEMQSQSKNPQRYSLRRIARDIGVEPSFLSKVERDLCTPPSELKVRQLARLLDEDEDYLVAISGRLGKELVTRIRLDPEPFSMMVKALEPHYFAPDTRDKVLLKATLWGAENGLKEECRLVQMQAIEDLEQLTVRTPSLSYLLQLLKEARDKEVLFESALGRLIKDKGGRPASHESVRVAAIDLYLRKERGLGKEAAKSWIELNLKIDRSTVQRYRSLFVTRHDRATYERGMEGLSVDDLLALAVQGEADPKGFRAILARVTPNRKK